MTTTFDGIRAIIVRDFDLPPERLQRDTLLEEIELDSLSITELVFSIEDEFKITAENTIPPFKTLGDIADYVARLIAERDAKPRVAAKSAAVPAKSTTAPTKSAAAKSGKRSGGARKASASTAKPTNGASRTNGANADGERRTKARAAKRPALGRDAPAPKPKSSRGGRGGARAR
jgi:acyl carrier protein